MEIFVEGGAGWKVGEGLVGVVAFLGCCMSVGLSVGLSVLSVLGGGLAVLVVVG